MGEATQGCVGIDLYIGSTGTGWTFPTVEQEVNSRGSTSVFFMLNVALLGQKAAMCLKSLKAALAEVC